MQQGSIVAIYIGPVRKGPMQLVDAVRAVPGKGLEGDRYFLHAGTFSKRLAPDKELTLIEEEAVEAMAERHGPFSAAESRRDIVTRGLALNELVGQELQLGEVRVTVLELCHPCGHLQRLSGKPVLSGLKNRGGVRAQILAEGVIRVGDAVRQLTAGEGLAAFLKKA